MSKLDVLRRLKAPALEYNERKPEPVVMKRSLLNECASYTRTEKPSIVKYVSNDILKQLEVDTFKTKLFSFYDVENIMEQFHDDLKQEFEEKLEAALLEQKNEYEKFIDRILRDSEAECCSIYI